MKMDTYITPIQKYKTNFKGYIKLPKLLERLGFKSFGPGHSSRNGYDLRVSDERRACFYDNRLWGKNEIEFTVMSYERVPEYKRNCLGFAVQTGTTHRYDIYTKYFEIEDEINEDVINELILIAKTIK